CAGGALKARTARAVTERLFAGFMCGLTNRKIPRGCLLVHGALASGDESASIRQELAAIREELVNAIRDRFKQAVKDGDLPTGTDYAGLARYRAAVLGWLALHGDRRAAPP